MTVPLDQVLQLNDNGTPVADIAAATGLPAGRVYALLRQHRPARTRSPRTRTSDVPAKVQALRRGGASVARVAELLGCSRQYVHRIGKEGTP